MAEGIQYKKGMELGETNSSIIPKFIENLRMHSEYGDLCREVDLARYRNGVVNYLKNHGIELIDSSKKDGLEFKLAEQEQDCIDIANRIVILANKILVTTREQDVPSKNFLGTEYGPHDYLEAVLGTLNPLEGENIIHYGSQISHLMSIDQKRNLFPTVAIDGFGILIKCYNCEKEQTENKKGKYSTPDLNQKYIELLNDVLEHSHRQIKNHGNYDLPDDGRKKIGQEIMIEIERLTKVKDLRIKVIN